MNDNYEHDTKYKALEERIANFKVTIKQLGNEVIEKDLEIKNLSEELEKIKHDNIGMSLMLDKLKEDNEKLLKKKELKVCDLDKVEEYIKHIGSRLSKLEKGIVEQEVSYSSTDLGKIMKQLNEQIKINSEQRFKIDELKEQTINQESLIADYEKKINKLEKKVDEQQYKIDSYNDNEEELKLAQHLLNRKEDDIKELLDRLNGWNKWHQNIVLKYRLGILCVLSILTLIIFVLILRW